MIKKFIAKVFGGKKRQGPEIFRTGKHPIRRDDLSQAALRVCEGLQQKGYAAFVVGGAVRDLLLGRHPKDYDVATNATPEQVRSVFRRSRIIGRRFRLVHVMFGAETVEVSTFRAHHTDDEATGSADEHGRLLRDNVFGSQEHDAIRRDFTVNAMFYDPQSDEVWDYQGGMADLKAKRLAMIGDPEARYREDPVRMLRAARLAAKLGFRIDPATEAPIARLAGLLDNVPSARLFDEVLKLLLSGHAVECVNKLHGLGLHNGLLPMLNHAMEDEASKRFVMHALKRTDERIAADKGVSPAFLLGALLWPLVGKRTRELEAQGNRELAAFHLAMDDVLDTQRDSLAIPRRFDATIKEMWVAQPRFEQRGGSKPDKLLTHPRFRACYDFLMLRAEAGDASMELATWWERFQEVDDDERAQMLLPDDEPRKKKRRRRRKKPGGVAGAPQGEGEGEAPDGDSSEETDAR